jgi:predicted membrane channel-forming protein YqfA (hemolysin III family)
MSDPSPSELEKRSAPSTPLKFSILRLALGFVVAGVSDVIGAFANLAPPIGWAVDVATAALLFVVLGWQWLLLPGLVLEAIPGVGVLPFWLLVVGAIAILGTPRPEVGQR